MLSVHEFQIPKTIKELRSFMGLMSYCRDFIENLAVKAKPLSDLLKGAPTPSTKIELLGDQLKIFNYLKSLLNDESKLTIPDFKKPFIITTDASSSGISGILAQRSENKDSIISFFSKKLNEAQTSIQQSSLNYLV